MEINKEVLVSPDLLTNKQIVDLLPVLDDLQAWAKQVQEYALNKAMEGEEYEGYKVVEGKSNRKWLDEIEVADALRLEGYDDAIIYEKKLKSITGIESLLGKKNFPNVLGHLVDKPVGKPALVPATDPRPVFNTNAQAAADFKD